MTTAPVPFELPDRMAALPARPFEFSPAAVKEAAVITADTPAGLYRRLLGDQESEAVLLAARRVLAACFGPATAPAEEALAEEADADQIAAEVAAVRARLAATLAPFTPGGAAGAEQRELVLAQRAPVGLLAYAWLDVVSQPATQPSIIVNRLFTHHFAVRGAGNARRSLAHRHQGRLEEAGVFLPEIGAAGFLDAAGARPLTAWHGCCYLALSRLPANFLPELIGVHYGFGALGLDDLLLGTEPVLAETELRATLARYLELASPAERRRLHTGLRLVLALESEQAGLAAELASWHRDLPLESKVAAIIARHAPYSGLHHQQVRVGGRLLSDVLSDPGLDLAAFLAEFRDSAALRRTPDGLSAFTRALKLGGPMFGIFDQREAETFQAWAASVQAGERPRVRLSPCPAGDERAAAWSAALAAADPPDVVVAEVGTPGDRELFYRLVNIENFANTRPLAADRAARLFDEAELLFTRGAGGRYTDASWFDYSPEALYQRCERVYWDKLVTPYQPLTEIPDRDLVVFLQTTYALGALVDAAWIHRTASLGRDQRPADAALFSIYADEVGYGDLRKNHITLIHRALHSMDIRLPHIREAAFMDQGDLPDELYGFSLHQLCMAQSPDTWFNEILGYNLAIEMFGLGELRLHEVQKLNHYGFDDCYEQAHLTIDNISAGHSRQAADIIVGYLDEVRRTLGEAAVAVEWRRIWRGYASLAWFVEHTLVKQATADLAAPAGLMPAGEAGPDDAAVDLMI